MRRAVTILSILTMVVVGAVATQLWGIPDGQKRQFYSCVEEAGKSNIAGCMASHGYDYSIWSLSCWLPRGKFEQKAGCYSPRDPNQPHPF